MREWSVECAVSSSSSSNPKSDGSFTVKFVLPVKVTVAREAGDGDLDCAGLVRPLLPPFSLRFCATDCSTVIESRHASFSIEHISLYC